MLRLRLINTLSKIFLGILIQTNLSAQTCAPDLESGQNLVRNGGFSDEYAEWKHDEKYIKLTEGKSDPGILLVSDDPNKFNPEFEKYDDHSAGADNNFLMIDGICELGVKFWKQDNIPVKPNTTYYFSVWISALKNLNDTTILRFNINGQPINGTDGLVTTISDAGTWVLYETTWESKNINTPTVELSIENATTEHCQEKVDFAIDDISFIPVCKYADSSPQPNLGNDTTICGSAGIDLDAHVTLSANTEVYWSDGLNGTGTSAPVKRKITEAGVYSICVKEGASCVKSDVIKIGDRFGIDLGPDMTLCNPISVTLDAGYETSGVKYKWYIGHTTRAGGNDTSKTYFVNKPGNYRVDVADARCGLRSDEMTIFGKAAAIARDTVFCPGPTEIVTLSVSPLNAGKYKWWGDSVSVDPSFLRQKGGNIHMFYGTLKSDYKFYVEDTGNFSVPVGPSFKVSTLSSPKILPAQKETRIVFDALEPIVIDTVYLMLINYDCSGSVGLDVYDKSGKLVSGGSSTYQFSLGNDCKPSNSVAEPQIIKMPVGISVPEGEGYSLRYNMTGNVKMVWYENGMQWGTTYSGAVKFTSPDPDVTGNFPNSVPGMFHWSVSVSPTCARVPVKAINKCICGKPKKVHITSPAASPYNLCPGENLKISATSELGVSKNGGYTYLWYKKGTIPGTPAATYTAFSKSGMAVADSGIYVLRITDGTENDSLCFLEDSIKVVVNPFPQASITNSKHDFCADENGITLSAKDAGTGATYEWFAGGNSQGHASGTKILGLVKAGNYKVKVTKEGCSKTSVDFAVKVNPLPVATITTIGEGLRYCQTRAGVKLDATSDIPGIFRWFDGTVDGPATALASTSASMTNAPKGTYRVEVVTAAGCKDTTDAVEVEIDSLPRRGSIKLTDSICIGSPSETYTYLDVVDARDYKWSLPLNAEFVSDTAGPGTASVTVDFATAKAGNITVTPFNHCGNGPIQTIAITYQNKPSGGELEVPDSVCEGDMKSVSLKNVVTNNSSLISASWQLPEDSYSVAGADPSSTLSPGIFFKDKGGYVIATPRNSCGEGEPIKRHVTIFRKVGGAKIAGADTICAYQEETYSLDPSSPPYYAKYYRWTISPALPASDFVVNGSTVKIKFGTASEYQLKLVPYNPCFEGPGDSIVIKNNGSPVPEVILTQLPSPACSDSLIKIVVTLKNAGTNPVRTIDINGSAQPATLDTIPLSNPVNGQKISYNLTSALACANPKTATATLIVNALQAPSKAVIKEADFTTCAKDTLLTAETTMYGTGKWSVRAGDPADVDATGKVSLKADSLDEKTARIYYTVSTAGNICRPTKDSIAIKIKPLIQDPSAGNDTIICISAGSLQLKGKGERVAAGETGTWTSVSSALVTSAGKATFTQAGESEFIYSINNGFCKKEDKVKVKVDALPSPALINEGRSKQTCTDCETLSGAAVSSGSRSWITKAGTLLLLRSDSSLVKICGLPKSSDTDIILSVKNGVCPAVTDTFTLKRLSDMTQPDAGKDTTVCWNALTGLHLKAINEPQSANGHEKGTWKSEGTAIVNSPDAISSSVSGLVAGANKFIYTIVNDNCPASMDTVVIFVNQIPADPGKITGVDTACAKTTETYTIPLTARATKYNWKITGGAATIVAASITNTVRLNFIDLPASDGPQKVTLEVLPENDCGESDKASTMEITVYPVIKPEVKIEASKNVICADSSASFKITSVSAETTKPIFSWIVKSATETAKGGLKDIRLAGLKNKDSIWVKMKSDYRCAAPADVISKKVEMKVFPMLPVSVKISSDLAGPVCEGTEVVFKADPINEGTLPFYKWKVGSNSLPDTIGEIHVKMTATTDISVVLTSNAVCYDNKTASWKINYRVDPLTAMEIEEPAATDTCLGSPGRNLSARIVTGSGTDLGTNPEYLWILQGNGKTEKSVSRNFSPSDKLPVGKYDISLKVTSSAKCPEVKYVILNTTFEVNRIPEAKITGDKFYCPGKDVTLTAGEPDMNYSWIGSPIQGLISDKVAVKSGNYRVLVIDPDSKCSSISDLFEVEEVKSRTRIIPYPEDSTACDKNSILLTSDQVGNTYLWLKGNDTLKTETSRVFYAKEPGNYKVIVTVAGGADCPVRDDITLDFIRRPAPRIDISDIIICETQPLWISAHDLAGDMGPINWYKIGSASPLRLDSGSFLVRSTGSYYVSQSNGKCEVPSDTVNVLVDRRPAVDITPAEITVVKGTPVLLDGTDKSGSSVSYSWSSANYPNTPEEEAAFDNISPVVTVIPVGEKTVFILKVKSENLAAGCEVTDSSIVRVEVPVHPWNSFSPNGDGIYDTWLIDNIENYPNAQIEVFNRWGNLVYKSKGYSRKWDGTNFRNGQPLPVATYYYVIYPHGQAINKPLTGDVSIVK